MRPGNMRERDFGDYHIFAAHEMPELETIFVETFEPAIPLGSRLWQRSRWMGLHRQLGMPSSMPAGLI